ncbi:MAG: hypothetical protein O3C58_13435, partial [Nitrospinae bacterium]|nr:hypothetical protein [Nitrospinota bacterium]
MLVLQAENPGIQRTEAHLLESPQAIPWVLLLKFYTWTASICSFIIPATLFKLNGHAYLIL